MLTLEPLSMEGAQKFWKDKIKLSPGEFNKLSDEAKLKAFSVSGIAKGDELSTVFEAMQKAVADGESFGDFKNRAKEVFDKRGWTGPAAWRVDNIFRTNIQTAYSVGRYKEMQAVSKTRPFWQYHAVNDSRTRPTHAALNGKVFRNDNPFWDKWYPPNGFRCRCTVTTLSHDDIAAEKIEVTEKDPTGNLIEQVDPVSGNKMPARALMPDRGFDFNPGKVQWGFASADTGKFTDTTNLRTAADYGRRSLENVLAKSIPDFTGAMLPAKEKDSFYKAEFEKRYGEEKILKDPAGEPVILSLRSFMEIKETGAKEVYKFNKPGHGESITLLQEMIEQPYEIWLVPQKNEAGSFRLAKRYVSVWKTEDKDRIGGLAVFEVVRGMFQGVTSFLPTKEIRGDNIKYLDRQRVGLLLYKK
ncbi:MAG: minor capsid protein [Deltaproteobacteria bacterium]|nr:minor capsid protein [Deltaproteobacteria bacterium]